MKPIATSYSLPLCFLQSKTQGVHYRTFPLPRLYFFLAKVLFSAALCCSYETLAKDQLTLEPKRNKALQEIHTICMYQRLESNVLWPIWLQKGATTHFLFNLTQKIKLICSEIDDRLVRAMLLTLAGCWLACDLVSQGLQQKACCSSHLKKTSR